MSHDDVAAVRRQGCETLPSRDGLWSEEKEVTKLGEDAESKSLGPQPETNNGLNRMVWEMSFWLTVAQEVRDLSTGVTNSPLQMWSPPKERFPLAKRWKDSSMRHKGPWQGSFDRREKAIRSRDRAWSGRLEEPHVRPKCIKSGLRGFVNGAETTALPDTGSASNVVSAAFAEKHRLRVRGTNQSFRLGSGETIKSSGIVNFLWSFADDCTKVEKLVCYVLPECSYDIILGRAFLIASETYTKYRHRLTKCLFSPGKYLRFNLLDNNQQSIEGALGSRHDSFPAQAVLDTGAECNVMSLGYARHHGLLIRSGQRNRNLVQFADGSCEETVGQLNTWWNFTDGKRVPIRFEILEQCSSDVVLGEDILIENDVFNIFASSITTSQMETDFWDLAPFDFIMGWQQGCENLISKMKLRKEKQRTGSRRSTIDQKAIFFETEERRRRDAWNFKYGYDGSAASVEERDAEKERKRLYDDRSRAKSNITQPLLIPSVPTATSSSGAPS